jgi:hypothetical protein
MIGKIYLILFFSLFTIPSSQLMAQALLSYGGGSYGAGTTLYRDYQAAGINPANLGIYDDKFQITFAFFDFNGLAHSDALTKSDLVASIIHGKTLSAEEKKEIALLFAEDGVSFNSEIMPAGIAVQIPQVGGFSFTWKERVNGNSILNPAFADLVFNGLNSTYIDTIISEAGSSYLGLTDSTQLFSELFDGSSFQFSWIREFNLSYGRKLLETDDFNIYGGAGIKFLRGNGVTDISYNNSGGAAGYAAFSPVFGIDYSDITHPSVELNGDLSPVGKGFGIDVGATASYKNQFFAGISITDIGSMKWEGNLVKLNDGIFDSLINFTGIDEAAIYSELQSLLNANGLFDWSEQAEIKQSLASQLRIGGSVRIKEKVEVGLDIIQPFNKQPGSMQRTTFAAMVNVIPIHAIKISTGLIGGGITDANIPLGISFSFLPEHAWQLSLGTNDIISLLTQKSPTLSLSVSLLRFRMGD